MVIAIGLVRLLLVLGHGGATQPDYSTISGRGSFALFPFKVSLRLVSFTMRIGGGQDISDVVPAF
ncbi:MAG TPA: hypothetical protein VGC82_04705, partial [Rhodopila sp.]